MSLPATLNGGSSVAFIRPDLGGPSNSTAIDSLPDELLLELFSAYRLDDRYTWTDGYGWVPLTHVCRKWRGVILASAVRLNLGLLCGNGTPVADLLERWPPDLPLCLRYDSSRHAPMSVQDEEVMFLALQHCDRVRSMVFNGLSPTLWRSLIVSTNQSFPILEKLAFQDTDNVDLVFPQAFSAPRLRSLFLDAVLLPTKSLLISSTTGIIELRLKNIPVTSYFSPEHLVAQTSNLSRLETLSVSFRSSTAALDTRRTTPEPHTPRVAFPKLCYLEFEGSSTWLEGFVGRIATQHLTMLIVIFFHQTTFTLPCLLQFIDMNQRAAFGPIMLTFYNNRVDISTLPDFEGRLTSPIRLNLVVLCDQSDRQADAATQLFRTLLPKFAALEKLALIATHAGVGWEEALSVAQWRTLLRLFPAVQTLWLGSELSRQLSDALRPGEGAPPVLELLPELREIMVSDMDIWVHCLMVRHQFEGVLDARLRAGRRVKLCFREEGWLEPPYDSD
ncbi:hypothetical protein BC834DRAFT_909369 [Gloeopeniophorella convolvens]|nr:hypothetical protein BC834DRAFT_909369 [Gloeopeniophorella convolvens]